MTLGNFPVNNWVSLNMWMFKMKHAIKVFLPVQTWYCSYSAPLHLTIHILNSTKNVQVFFFSSSLALLYKRTRQWIIKRSPLDLCLFEVVAVLQKNVRDIIANRVKDGCGRKVKVTREKQNTGYRINKALVALGGTILHPHINWAWHL